MQRRSFLIATAALGAVGLASGAQAASQAGVRTGIRALDQAHPLGPGDILTYRACTADGKSIALIQAVTETLAVGSGVLHLLVENDVAWAQERVNYASSRAPYLVASVYADSVGIPWVRTRLNEYRERYGSYPAALVLDYADRLVGATPSIALTPTPKVEALHAMGQEYGCAVLTAVQRRTTSVWRGRGLWEEKPQDPLPGLVADIGWNDDRQSGSLTMSRDDKTIDSYLLMPDWRNARIGR
mgnify:CR=1 FL=1